MDDPYKEMRSHFFESQGKSLRKCLVPSMQCPKLAIRAHTVQNARTLELIAQNGHVIGFQGRIDEREGPVIELKTIGRNNASTFTGLCAKHDRELFKRIDTEAIDVGDVGQLYLLAYRPILRELHSTMDGAIKIQAGYEKRVSLGLDLEAEPSPAGIIAVEHMAKSWLVYRYKCEYDRIMIEEEYDKVIHHTRILRDRTPTIAASSFFSINEPPSLEDIEGISLNVLPLDVASTLIVVSCAPKDAASVEKKLNGLFDIDDEEFTFRLSKLILGYSETPVLAPKFFGTWSRGKTKAVEQFFRDTLFGDYADSSDKRLNLFDKRTAV
ncbi:MAG TPA: hypothetical protein VK901_07440 [Nitrospiraceae bacterium]|nr:hypothetical protein [Nitrospiraceae bacterium]